MGIQDIIGMMNGGGTNPMQMLTMINKMMGTKYSANDIQSKLMSIQSEFIDSFTKKFTLTLCSICKDDTVKTIVSKSTDRSSKEKAITELLITSAPSYIKGLQDSDLDKLYSYIKEYYEEK